MLRPCFVGHPQGALYCNIKLLQLKYWKSDMLRPFFVDYSQGAYTNIFI
jgi:hypothetical protein